MIKYILFFLTLFCFIPNSYTQNEILELPVDYQSTYFDGKESLAISNNKTGELILFVEDYNFSKAYLLNSNFEVVSELIFQSLPSTFKNFIGSQINDNGTYSILFTNTSKKKYGELNLDFSNKKGVINELEFKLKKEVYVESVSFEGDFYMISATKKSNNVNFYGYKDNMFFKRKTISFDFLESVSINGNTKRAYNHLVSKGLGSFGSLVKMDINTPNAIEVTSKPNKLYIIKNQFVFTFDDSKKKTKVAVIDPKTFKLEVLEFKKPSIGQTEFINHNSYLYDDKIFQIKSSSSSLKFTIKDFESNTLLKEITLKKEDSITFKNTPIIQEGPAFIAGRRTREMEKTSKFLRKVSSGDIGISVYKQKGNYKITLGSKVEIRNAGFSPMGGVPLGGFGSVAVTFNPTFFAYGGYSSSKSTHIDCLFDNEFKHVIGEVSENVFDRIKNFEKAFDKKYKKLSAQLRLKNVFRHRGKLYFSYLNTKDKNYHLVEFLD